ncbi:MAG: hypothetical protein ACRD2W_05685 [Acidimicrobiales bacterium]
MKFVAVASVKSSPGVSVVAELIALLWPDRTGPVLFDCDPAGSGWVLRPGVAVDPGVVSLAAGARRGLNGQMIADNFQGVGALDVLVGPAAGRQASAALRSLGADLALAMRELPPDTDVVVADCGRLFPGSPAYDIGRVADHFVLVCPATASGVVQVAPWVEDLSADGCHVALVLAAPPPRTRHADYTAAEIANTLRVAVAGLVAHDREAARTLHQNPGRVDRISRTPLARSVAAITAELARASAPGTMPHRGTATGPSLAAARSGT